MSVQENKEAEVRLTEAVWNRHDADAADEFVDPNVIEHNSMLGPGLGREGYKRALRMVFSAFPDVRLVHEDLLGEGDKVVERWTIHGTHLGEFMGLAPTRKSITVSGVDIYRYAGGKRVETWSFYDSLSLMRQLGGTPTK